MTLGAISDGTIVPSSLFEEVRQSLPDGWGSVKYKGAVGDDVANDRSAIQAALDAYKVVIFPPPVSAYRIDGGGLRYYDGQRIIGLGGFTRVPLRARSLNEPLLQPDTPAGSKNGIRIEGLWLDGMAATAGGVGLSMDNVRGCLVEDVRIDNFPTGLLVTNSSFYNTYNNIHVRTVTTGIKTTGGANDNRFFGGSVITSTKALHVDADSSFFGYSLEGFTEAGLYADTNCQVDLYGTRYESTSVGAVGVSLAASMAAGARVFDFAPRYYSVATEVSGADTQVAQYFRYGAKTLLGKTPTAAYDVDVRGNIGSDARVRAGDGSDADKAFAAKSDPAVGFYKAAAGIMGVTAIQESAEAATPGSAPADKARFFTRDNGSGKTQLCAIFPSGAVQVIATEP